MKLKKYITIFIMMTVFLTILLINFKSIAFSDANIVLDTKNVVQGNEIEVNINLQNSVDFSAANFTLTYDSTILKYTGYTIGNSLKKSNGTINGEVAINANISGKIEIGYMSEATQESETKSKGKLFTIRFKVNSGEGTSTDIKLDAKTLKRHDGSDVVANIKDGKLSIISGIKINHTSLLLEKGQSSALTVSTLPNSVDISGETITWNSENKSVVTVSSTGIVTAVGPGTTEITVTVLGITKKCTVTVIAPLQSISLNKKSITLDIGDSQMLDVIYNPTNTTDSKNVTWSSSNKSVAIVGQNGLVKAIGNGTTIITAKVGDKTATCTVNVWGMLGDLDKDENITAYDAYKALEASVNISTGVQVEEKIILRADVDKDQKVTASDAYKILQYSVGVIDEF